MLEQTLECLVDTADATRPLHAVRPSKLAECLDSLPAAQGRFLRQLDFSAAPQELMFLPADDGVAGAVLGLGEDQSPAAFGNLAYRLPEGIPWHLQPGDYDPAVATLGFCLGAYRYNALKAAKRGPARLLASNDQAQSRSAASATWMVRDLVNTPANLLGPVELADFAASLARHYGVAADVVADDGAGCGLSHDRRRRARFVTPRARRYLPLVRQHRPRQCATDFAVRQRRLFRHRRLRHQAVERHAADEKGHGRRRHDAWARQDDHGR